LGVTSRILAVVKCVLAIGIVRCLLVAVAGVAGTASAEPTAWYCFDSRLVEESEGVRLTAGEPVSLSTRSLTIDGKTLWTRNNVHAVVLEASEVASLCSGLPTYLAFFAILSGLTPTGGPEIVLGPI